MDLGDLELRGILARKSQLLLRLDCSRAWFRLRCSQINARANIPGLLPQKYRAPNRPSPVWLIGFFGIFLGRDIFGSRFPAREGWASYHVLWANRILSINSHAL